MKKDLNIILVAQLVLWVLAYNAYRYFPTQEARDTVFGVSSALFCVTFFFKDLTFLEGDYAKKISLYGLLIALFNLVDEGLKIYDYLSYSEYLFAIFVGLTIFRKDILNFFRNVR